ncbi:hypothetical protein J4H92_11750 [Leucobacter weissii]|uniref:Transglutaminase-like domain-containing protein n=1 Tax=Leucobacter weissii TaxID=1983706 RepID=A0A939SB47_9MICO|nr:transglutaminase domain-containing protein [Leucobacter weissii]MBO1902622.1 hypothetical protein [Leucobacter weissii]
MTARRSPAQRRGAGRAHGAERSGAPDPGGSALPRAVGRLVLGGVLVVLLWTLVLAAFMRIFAAGPWFWQAWSISAAVLLAASLARAARPGARTAAALAGSVAGAAVWSLCFAASGRAPAWFRDPLVLVEEIRIGIISGAAPLDLDGPLTDVLLLVVLLVCILTMLVLIGLGRPLAAGVLTALLLLIPSMVTGVPASWPVLLGGGLLLALLAWLGSPAPSRAGLIAAATAIAVAAGLVALVPQGRDRVWNESLILGPVSDTVPDVTIALADDLRQRSNARAFTFTSAESGSHRLVLATLSDFTGGRWLPGEDLDPDGLTVDAPRSPTTTPPTASDGPQETGAASVTVKIEGLLSSWLPLPQSSRSVVSPENSDFDPSEWRWAADAATARSEQSLTRRGDRYTAYGDQLLSDGDASYWIIDDASEGQRIAAGSARVFPRSALELIPDPDEAPAHLAPYLDLPDGMPAEVLEAIDGFGPAEGPPEPGADRYEIGVALQAWFRSGEFSYDEAAPYEPGADPGDPYAVMTGLLEQRTGFCVHYASTFAVMARALGAPTRIAVGYASRASGGTETVVQGRDLHAWPEIYLDDIGWMAFEPTPGGAGFRADTDQQPSEGPEESPNETDPAPEPDPEESPDPEETPEERAAVDEENPASDAASERGAATRIVLSWAAVALIVGLLLTPATARLLRARVRRRRIAAGDGAAQHAWNEFLDTAVDLGLLERSADRRAPRARTAEALIEHLESGGRLPGDAAGAARALADAMTAERYAAAAEPADGTVKRLLQASRGLRTGRTRWARLRALLLPRSVLRHRGRERRESV